MKRSKGSRRDFVALRRRRRRAARLFRAKVAQAEISRILDVSRQSVSRWHKDWRGGGGKALEGAGRAGRKPRLSSADLRKIDAELRKGSRAHGFPSDLWTLRRVAVVIERLTGIRYHAGHVSYFPHLAPSKFPSFQVPHLSTQLCFAEMSS